MKKYTKIFNLIMGLLAVIMLLIEPFITILVITAWLLIYYVFDRHTFELKVKHLIKHIWIWMQKYDWTWSPLLLFGAFWFVGWFMIVVLKWNVGTYDLGFIQPLFLSMAITSALFGFAFGGLRFQWKALFDYQSSRKEEINAFNDFKLSTPCQRILFLSFYFTLYVVVNLMIYLNLV